MEARFSVTVSPSWQDSRQQLRVHCMAPAVLTRAAAISGKPGAGGAGSPGCPFLCWAWDTELQPCSLTALQPLSLSLSLPIRLEAQGRPTLNSQTLSFTLSLSSPWRQELSLEYCFLFWVNYALRRWQQSLSPQTLLDVPGASRTIPAVHASAAVQGNHRFKAEVV